MKQTIIIYALSICTLGLFAQVEIGGTSNFTEVEDDGTIEFHGDATVWNDFVVPMTSVKEKSLDGKQPEYEAYFGEIFEWNFVQNKLSEVGMVIQMPHDWDGSTIYPHIHWSPEVDGNKTGTVVWSIDYTWVNYQGEFPAITTLTAETTFSSVPDEHKHLIAEFNNGDGIIPSVGSQDGISSLILIRLYRDAGEGNDTYDDGAFALSFDIHYRSNTIGSRQEYIK